MDFTTSMVLSSLEGCPMISFIEDDENKTYKRLALLYAGKETLDDDTLYICWLSDALKRNTGFSSCHFVAANDCYIEDNAKNDKERFRNMIIVSGDNASVPLLHERISRYLMKIIDWKSSLASILLKEGTYQELIDESEEIFGNTLLILDDAFRLLASSKRFRSDDPMHQKLYREGYFSAEDLEMWYSSGMIAEYRSRTDILSQHLKIGRYPSYSRWCRHDGIPLVHGVLVFSCSSPKEDSIDLFRIFMDAIELCFKKTIRNNEGAVRTYNQFLTDIILGRITDPRQIEGVASSQGIPVSGNFSLCRIAFRDINKVLIGSFCRRVSSAMPNSLVVSNGTEVFLINQLKEAGAELEDSPAFQAFWQLLTEHDAMCGVSFPFTSILDLKAAAAQALYALNYSSKVKNLLSEEKQSDHIYYYRHVFPLCLIDMACAQSADPMANNEYVARLTSLKQYDEKNNSSLFEILITYLIHERSATTIARVLHMHRSTVLYHIQKTEEILGLDLDEFMVRQGLLSAYQYMLLQNP